MFRFLLRQRTGPSLFTVNRIFSTYPTQPPTSGLPKPPKRAKETGDSSVIKKRIKASTKVTKTTKIISRAKQKQLEEDYDELKDPEIVKKIEKLEKKHQKIYTNTEIADEDYVLEAGEKEFDEDEAELKEPVTRTEPAFDIKVYSKQLAVFIF